MTLETVPLPDPRGSWLLEVGEDGFAAVVDSGEAESVLLVEDLLQRVVY